MWDLWDLLFFLLLLYIFFTLIMKGLLILYYIISIKWTSPTSSCKVPQAPQVLVRSHFLKNELTHTIFLVRSHKYVVALVINVRKKNINCLTSIVSLKTNWHTHNFYTSSCYDHHVAFLFQFYWFLILLGKKAEHE